MTDFLHVEKFWDPNFGDARWLFLRSVARQDYVVARVTLFEGFAEVGCMLAQQSIEAMLKAIIALHHKKKATHDLKYLLQLSRDYIPFADEILKNPDMVHLLDGLFAGYRMMRYGEAKYSVQSDRIVRLLDELIFKLDKLYAETIKGSFGSLFVPDSMRETFLRDNHFFMSDMVTSNPLALFGLPVVNLPELPPSQGNQ
jgi:HEPN domain-containing protein